MNQNSQRTYIAGIGLTLILFFSWSQFSRAQIDEIRGKAPNVYLDCNRGICDKTYIRSEITFINYMNDRENADVHVMITRRRTGSGGFEYTMGFIGLKENKDKDATLKYFSKSTDTEDEVRSGMVNILKQGLIPYLADTPLAEYISISYDKKNGMSKPAPAIDKWNYWVFSVGLRGNLALEELSKQFNYSLSLSANRTTEDLKFRFWANTTYNEERYQIDETEEIISKTKRNIVYSQLVKSLSGHLSAGLSAILYTSTYDNAQIFGTLGPAIEYNIFPYEISTRRELRIQYRIEFTMRKYNEITIYDKDHENLFKQTLQVILEIKEPWGSAGLELQGSTYFHDFSKNNFRVEAGLSLRVFKGFSFNIGGEYSRVRDQLSLPKAETSKDEILLQLKELATGYSLRLRMGLSYRFGSMYSNVVNPRFGNR